MSLCRNDGSESVGSGLKCVCTNKSHTAFMIVLVYHFSSDCIVDANAIAIADDVLESRKVVTDERR